jgi:hypothetical protein
MDEHTEHKNESNGNGKGGARETPETMFDSLRIAVGDLAERAGPTVRELSARAAELTATAANKAAPYARKAGSATADASLKLAESARGWAADLRAEQEGDAATADDAGTAGGAATAVAEPPAPEAVVETPYEDVTPSDQVAEEPPPASEPTSFESTAEAEGSSPAFEDDRPGDDRSSDDRPFGSPGI